MKYAGRIAATMVVAAVMLLSLSSGAEDDAKQAPNADKPTSIIQPPTHTMNWADETMRDSIAKKFDYLVYGDPEILAFAPGEPLDDLAFTLRDDLRTQEMAQSVLDARQRTRIRSIPLTASVDTMRREKFDREEGNSFRYSSVEGDGVFLDIWRCTRKLHFFRVGSPGLLPLFGAIPSDLDLRMLTSGHYGTPGGDFIFRLSKSSDASALVFLVVLLSQERFLIVEIPTPGAAGGATAMIAGATRGRPMHPDVAAIRAIWNWSVFLQTTNGYIDHVLLRLPDGLVLSLVPRSNVAAWYRDELNYREFADVMDEAGYLMAPRTSHRSSRSPPIDP